ncbi:MAG: phosphodiester glycosidase family protein [Synechococcaceae cyanobacterium SM2_3_2]|nr:phosphodiester glycosidase family protein [Synechococcaceae cyanobacterium SM2_3_2]
MPTRPTSAQTGSSQTGADAGIRLERLQIPNNPDPIPVWVLRIPVSARQVLTLRPMWADPGSLVGTAELEQMAAQQGTMAAINAGFFNRNTRQPIGALRLDGRWLSNPILGRGVMAWDDAGRVQFGRVRFEAAITTQIGDRIPVVGINTAYILPGLSQVTPDWGLTYTTQTDDETLITIQADRVIAIQSAAAAGSLTLGIPRDGYLLAARELEGQLQAQKLLVGDQLRLVWNLDSPDLADLPHMVGAGPLLIQNGAIVLDAELEQFQPSFITQRAARSAIGLSAEGSLVWVVAGQAQESTGLTLAEMAALMQQLGSVQALNLDGGNSSTLVWQGQALNLPLLDPSSGDGSGASPPRPWRPRVHNGIGLFR